jgi:hypothetical protein
MRASPDGWKRIRKPEKHYRFRRNKGCTGDLAILATEIIKAFEEWNTVWFLFLDINSLYDNVHCLKAVCFSGNLLPFIFNLVLSRELETKYGWLDHKDWTYKGLPLGSVLSPNLYSLYMAGLKCKINQNCELSNMQTMLQFIQLTDVAELACR